MLALSSNPSWAQLDNSQEEMPDDLFGRLFLAESDTSWATEPNKGTLSRQICPSQDILSSLNAVIKDWAELRTIPDTDLWPSLNQSADYAHLTAFESRLGRPFSLTPTVMQRLANRNGFALGNKRRVLFGLRGATLTEGDSIRPSKEIRMRAVLPNLRDFRCVIGVWDRGDENSEASISAFTASTVPHVTYVAANLRCGAASNCLTTGKYRYQVGLHGLTDNFKGLRQCGVFVMKGTSFYGPNETETTPSDVLVLRTFNDLKYSPKAEEELWHRVSANAVKDNIHSAVFDYENIEGCVGPKKYGIQFSSAGCQVVKGTYRRMPCRAYAPMTNEAIGPFADLRASAGLSNPSIIAVDPSTVDFTMATAAECQTPAAYRQDFDYILLTGLEASAEASGVLEGDYVRFGSQGDYAFALQRSLISEQTEWIGQPGADRIARADGKFGANSVSALLYSQKRYGMETGIQAVL
ncbi:MAG: hypothetical protein AAGJ73_13220 [Pseudomonadota bacterium]